MAYISVIVPLYNKEKYIKNCINSILIQTYSDFEIILVDDGSTDNSKQQISEFMKLDSRVKYYWKVNGGVSSARNYGIQYSTGKYLTFLDADDYWDENFLQLMLDKIGNNSICYCGNIKIYNNSLNKSKIVYKKGDILSDYLLNITKPNMNSWLLKKSLISDASLLFDEKLDYGEDMLFFSKLLFLNKDVTYVNKSLSFYNKQVESSLSNIKIDTIYKDYLWINNFLLFIDNKNDNNRRSKYIKRIISEYLIPAFITYRLWILKGELSTEEIIHHYNKFSNYIDNASYINKLRSIKLKLQILKLKKYINALKCGKLNR